MKLQGSNNVKSTVETIIKTFEHHPSIKLVTWPATPGGPGGGMVPSLFCVAKRKKGGKGKKERVSKQKLLKGFHQGQNIIALAILERLEFENFSCRSAMVVDNTFQCSRASPL